MQPPTPPSPVPPSRDGGRRAGGRAAALLLVLAISLGGLVAGLVVAHVLRPSKADMFQAARELVPPEAELVKAVDVSFSSFFGGFDAVDAEFTANTPDHLPVVAAVEANAAARDWSQVAKEEAGNATIRYYRQGGLTGRVSVRHDIGTVEGDIDVGRNGDVQLRRQLIWGGVGTAFGTALGVAFIPRRHHRDHDNRGATP